MKILLTCTCLALLMATGAVSAEPVTREQAWTETYAVASGTPRLTISNIWGSVRVQLGAADEIVVAVTESRSAPNQRLFDVSLQRIRLDIEVTTDSVTMDVGDPEQGWYDMDPCRGCRVDYQFDVRVPANTIVDVGTVMDGRVEVSGIAGVVSASNVNGTIQLDNLRNCEVVSSVNGRVKLQFDAAPQRDCNIDTINGDITMVMPADSSLDVTADLFNGEIHSDFPADPLSFPATVEHVVEDGRNLYRIQKLSGVRIGAGGPTYTVASINGDIRIRRN